MGCVGAKRLLSWQNEKHWLTIKEGLIGLQAVADLQDALTNDFRAPCVFAVGVLPPTRPQQHVVMVTIRMRSIHILLPPLRSPLFSPSFFLRQPSTNVLTLPYPSLSHVPCSCHIEHQQIHSVYLRQAIFGLSACAAIKDLFTAIDTPAAPFQPCRSLMQPTYEFEKSPLPSSMANQLVGGGRNDLHEFTLAGLLRYYYCCYYCCFCYSSYYLPLTTPTTITTATTTITITRSATCFRISGSACGSISGYHHPLIPTNPYMS